MATAPSATRRRPCRDARRAARLARSRCAQASARGQALRPKSRRPRRGPPMPTPRRATRREQTPRRRPPSAGAAQRSMAAGSVAAVASSAAARHCAEWNLTRGARRRARQRRWDAALRAWTAAHAPARARCGQTEASQTSRPRAQRRALTASRSSRGRRRARGPRTHPPWRIVRASRIGENGRKIEKRGKRVKRQK